jgi:hypothetical protein
VGFAQTPVLNVVEERCTLRWRVAAFTGTWGVALNKPLPFPEQARRRHAWRTCPAGAVLSRRRCTLAFELLAQLVGTLLQIFLQLLLLLLEHLGIGGRTFIGFLETIA